MRNQLATILFATLITLTACGKKKEEAAGGAGGTTAEKPAAAAPASAPAKLGWKKLGSLGLEAEVPDDANIEDTTKGAGFPSVTIYATPTTFVSGAGDMSDLKPTLEETKKQLEKDPNKLKGWTKEDKTADGWVLEGDRESMTGGALFAISVRRTLGGKPFDCSTNADSKEARDKALKLCQSLRAAQ